MVGVSQLVDRKKCYGQFSELELAISDEKCICKGDVQHAYEPIGVIHLIEHCDIEN